VCSDQETSDLLLTCQFLSCVYREHNRDADTLSKKGLGGTSGLLFFEELLGSVIIRAGSINLFQSSTGGSLLDWSLFCLF